MFLFFVWIVLFEVCFVIRTVVCSQGRDRELYFPTYYFFADRRLIKRKIQTEHVKDLDHCEFLCYQHDNCVSLNIQKDPDSSTGQQECELNNSTHMEHGEDLTTNNAYLYRGAKNACGREPPCDNSAICQSGFSDKGYRCLCYPGFTGEHCDTDIDECTSTVPCCSPDATCNNTKGSYQCRCNQGYSGDGKECQDIDECTMETHNCSSDAVCNNTGGSYSCKCKPGYHGDGINCSIVEPSTCQEAYDRKMLNESQLVTLKVDSILVPVYCHLGDFGCGDGGWTQVMKLDGHKNTFNYNSEYWKDTNEYNLPGGETGFDAEETKLPTYWKTSFTKICLGMKIGEQMNFLVINKQATSLFSLIADGKYRETSLGSDTWTTLIGSQVYLQPNCNNEGFNAFCSYLKSRIGMFGNNENDCRSCDSGIVFGTGWQSSAHFATTGGRVRVQGKWCSIKAMGYILVQ